MLNFFSKITLFLPSIRWSFLKKCPFYFNLNHRQPVKYYFQQNIKNPPLGKTKLPNCGHLMLYQMFFLSPVTRWSHSGPFWGVIGGVSILSSQIAPIGSSLKFFLCFFELWIHCSHFWPPFRSFFGQKTAFLAKNTHS